MPEEPTINTVLGRVNTAIDNLQTAQQTVVNAVQQLHTHMADPQAHGVDDIESDISDLQSDMSDAQTEITNIKNDYVEKDSISNSLNLDSSTNVASSKAVKDLGDLLESDYVPKTAISDAVNSSSQTNVASSKAVKDLSDSVTSNFVAKVDISDATDSSSHSNVASSKAVKDLSDDVAENYVPKSAISDAIDSESQTDVASSKAVSDLKSTIETELNDYIEKASISDALNLDSSTNVASSKAVKELKDTITADESALASVRSTANSAYSQANTNKNNISLINIALNGKASTGDVTALADRVTVVEGKQETDEANISALQTTTATHTSEIESLDSRVTQNETDISSVTLRVEGFLDSEVSQEGINNLNDINAKFTEIDTTTDALDAKFSNYILKSRLSDSVLINDSNSVASSTAVKTAYDLANTANTQANLNANSIVGFGNRFTRDEQDIDNLESRMDTAEDDIDDLDTRLTANEAQTGTNKTDIATINGKLPDFAVKASISDRVDLDNSNYIASSKAVKTAYDLAHTADVKADNITSTAALKANIKDSINSSSSTDMASSLAVKTVNDALVTLTNTVNTFLSGEPDDGTIDRLSELVREIQNNRTDLDDVLANKVSKSDISDAINSNSSTNVASSKAVKTVQDNIPLTATATPLLASGNGSVGSSAKWAKEDHVHPEQTTITGNAGTATALETARTIEISGDASGSASFDGTSNIDIEIAIADDSHNHVISNVDGLQTALNGKSNTGHGHVISDTTGLQDALDGKSNVGHGHVISDVENLQTTLDGKAPFSHNQASNTIDAMTGYSKPASGSAISASDTLNSAVGKLEAKADTHAIDNEVVHLTGDEDITGTKTFLGSKKIAFKQAGANDKLGFTLYNNSGKEQGYLEYNPTNKISGAPLFTLGNYASAANELSYIGFRRYSSISGASGAYNLLAPLIADAKRHFNLTTTYTNFFLMLGITDGTNTVSADNGGVVDISTLASGSCTGNSASATEFQSNQSVTLTGDATGTSSSKAGWSVPVTLANTGVNAGRYTSVNVDSKGRVTSGNIRHSYTLPANSAKNWYRIADADYGPIDPEHPLHVQFFITMWNTGVNKDYYQRWFVDGQIFGRNAGLRIFGNVNIPFSQMRILYENTDADVDSTDTPKIDLYLNYVIDGTTYIEIEEVYNSGFTFASDGEISASTVPSGFESRAVGTQSNGVQYAETADYATRPALQRSNITANKTLADNNTYRMQVLNCTNTITLTLPSTNSANAWFLIKNFNTTTGTVTIHPSTTSVLIDGVNQDIVLQPNEWVFLANKTSNNYSIVGDGRWRHQIAHLNGLKLADIPLGTLLGEVSTQAS